MNNFSAYNVGVSMGLLYDYQVVLVPTSPFFALTHKNDFGKEKTMEFNLQ